MFSILHRDFTYTTSRLTTTEVSKFRDSTILITGCAGFLGYYFMQFLASQMDDLQIKKIIGLDNFMLGRPKWIDCLSEDPRVSIYPFNIITDDIARIESALEADYVIHMASIASPVFYRKYPIETLDANIWGLRRLLEFYKERTIKGFLFFSSSEIYGDPSPENVPTGEEYRGLVSATGARACYDESKRFGETMCMLFSQQYGMPIGVVRPFNNYGPGMKLNDKRVPADFAYAVKNGKDIVLLSDGSPTRTFCYIADAVAGYLKVLLHGEYDYFNIGIEFPEISMSKLAEIYRQAGKEILGYKGQIEYRISEDKKYLEHNPSRRCPDISKARKILGYNPTIQVEAGIHRFLQHIKESKEEDLIW